MNTIVSQYASFVAATGIEQIPNEVVEKARQVLIDHLGVSLYGSQHGELTPIVIEMVTEIGSRPTCSIVGTAVRADGALAALANAVAAHTIELDDGHRHGTSHPACAVIPAAMAVAEEMAASFQELLRAIVLGYEVMLRIATAINPSHLSRGFHSTGTCGSLGAAIAAACLYGFDELSLGNSLAIAGLQSAGLQEMLYNSPMIKPLQPGKAALAGVLSARMAGKGAQGPNSLFEGPYGFFQAMTDEVHEEALLSGLGDDFEIMRTYTKLYPTCRHAHCPIDLALQLRSQIPADSEIEQVVVETYDFAIKEVGQIWHPSTKAEAMFSLPYSVSTALLQGRFTMAELDQGPRDERATNLLADRVKIVRSPALDAAYPAKRGARMAIELQDKTILRAEQGVARGEQELPISREELTTKYESLASTYLNGPERHQLWDLVHDRPPSDVNCQDIFSLIAGKSAR